jgi:hypothetical protein
MVAQSATINPLTEGVLMARLQKDTRLEGIYRKIEEHPGKRPGIDPKGFPGRPQALQGVRNLPATEPG